MIDFEEAEKLFDTVREPYEPELSLEEAIFPLVRKPPSTDVIVNLETLVEEDDDNQVGDYPDSEGTEEESIDSDDGEDEAFEPNVLPFEKNK